MLVTGAKKPGNIQDLLLKIALKGISRGAIDGGSMQTLKLSKRRLADKLYMTNITAKVGDHYKSKQ
ncbi:hypothetical protein D3C76_1012830 [compost metagenome]